MSSFPTTTIVWLKLFEEPNYFLFGSKAQLEKGKLHLRLSEINSVSLKLRINFPPIELFQCVLPKFLGAIGQTRKPNATEETPLLSLTRGPHTPVALEKRIIKPSNPKPKQTPPPLFFALSPPSSPLTSTPPWPSSPRPPPPPPSPTSSPPSHPRRAQAPDYAPARSPGGPSWLRSSRRRGRTRSLWCWRARSRARRRRGPAPGTSPEPSTSRSERRRSTSTATSR